MEPKSPASSAKTSNFYGSKKSTRYKAIWSQKLTKCEEQAESFKRQPIPLTRKLRVDDPLPVFVSFPRQQMAFDFAKTCSEDVHVFSEELDGSGKRQYIVSTLDEFWHKYRRMEPENRHYYEVIPEGAACKLYFDLEFKKEFNQEHSGSAMVDTFIKYVCFHLQETFELICDRRHVLDLDSSTDAKFSRHLIFNLPGTVFKDNIHVGNFVHKICSALLSVCSDQINETMPDDAVAPESKIPRRALEENAVQATKSTKERICEVEPDDLRTLLLRNDKGQSVIFCDQGVYTKNRNFRLYKSSKYGKNAFLEVAKENSFKVTSKDRGSFHKDHDYLLFLGSLISNVSLRESSRDVRILTYESSDPKRKRKTATQTSSYEETDQPESGYEHSPYPQIDDFISTVICKGDVQGVIRSWMLFSQGKLLMFEIERNRWCENIGRQHKSNHIMMVVDLRNGVYYQKCHDPDCKEIDYRSPERPIPVAICPFYQSEDLERSIEEELEEDNEELFRIAEDAEKSFTAAQTNDDDACEGEEQPLDSTLCQPWNDLPVCDTQSE